MFKDFIDYLRSKPAKEYFISNKFENKIILDVSPVPKPRQTKSDVWKKRPSVMRYREFADKCREEFKKQNITLPNTFAVFFLIQTPKSWSKKKTQEKLWTPHDQKPDRNNLTKALEDALMEEDQGIWSTTETKIWADRSQIIILF